MNKKRFNSCRGGVRKRGSGMGADGVGAGSGMGADGAGAGVGVGAVACGGGGHAHVGEVVGVLEEAETRRPHRRYYRQRQSAGSCKPTGRTR